MNDARQGTIAPSWKGRRAPPLLNFYDAWQTPAAPATVNAVASPARKLSGRVFVALWIGAIGLATVPWWI